MKWIIRGAGKIGRQMVSFLKEFDETIECFVDSDPQKNNSFVDGIIVKDEHIFNNLESDYVVCIAIAQDTLEIKENIQRDYHIPEKQVVSYLECWRDLIDTHIEELMDINVETEEKSHSDILFGMSKGLGLGGIETWSITMGNILRNKGYTVKYLVPFGRKDNGYDCIETSAENMSMLGDKNYMWENVKIFSRNLPCVFFADRFNDLLPAAYICKRLFPEKIWVVSIVHGGRDENIKKHLFFNKWVDAYIGVAQRGICEKIVNFGIPRDKVFHVVCPVNRMKSFDRIYSSNQRQMEIGYAARIDFSDRDKRQDYLLSLLLMLSESPNQYRINIAGDGPSREEVEKFIGEHNLQKMVTLHGYIEREKMDAFWKKQDIFINVSDSEGNCMAMMEAIGQGTVPVLTDVSGVRDSVVHEENGFIVDTGDMNGIAHYIDFLYHNRDMLPLMGRKGWEWINQNYNEERALECILSSCKVFYGMVIQTGGEC